MKNLLLISVLLMAGKAVPQCAIKPIKPIPPIGCKDVRAVCECDTRGKCEWVWICVPEKRVDGGK
jgi:hypothetical protein